MQSTDIERAGNPQEPQAPVNPTPTQPGKGDDFTQPRKENEQASMGRRADINPGRRSDEPIEKQDLREDEEFELEEEDEYEYDDIRPPQTH